MPNVIGDIEILKGVLFNFNPKKVIKKYPTYLDLLNAIKRENVNTPSKVNPKNSRSLWVIYAKSAISSANFLQSFRNSSEFHDFVGGFYTNEHSRLALPLLLKEEIIGFGFALACDFLKENGYPKFVKPDTHMNDICRGVGITSATTDFGVFKDVITYCTQNNIVPYEFDKLMWLIGSGDFYESRIKIATKKVDFINKFNRKYGSTRA